MIRRKASGSSRAVELLLCLASAGTAACVSHAVKVEPLEIKPIHLTMDINIRVQRELESFFDFEQQAQELQTSSSAPAGSASVPDTTKPIPTAAPTDGVPR